MCSIPGLNYEQNISSKVLECILTDVLIWGIMKSEEGIVKYVTGILELLSCEVWFRFIEQAHRGAGARCLVSIELRPVRWVVSFVL